MLFYLIPYSNITVLYMSTTILPLTRPSFRSLHRQSDARRAPRPRRVVRHQQLGAGLDRLEPARGQQGWA